MHERYLLEKCEMGELLVTKEKIEVFFKENLVRYSDKEYLYWDKLKYKTVPEGFADNKELWGFVKIMRNTNHVSPVLTENGEYFRFGELPFSKKLLHEIDKNTSGTFFTNISDTDRKLFVANGMLEEAISSSQLEWASTTTKNAKKMIQERRKPRNKDEQMIMNNYEAMNFIKNDLIHKELEEWDLLYLQSLLTKKTLEKVDEEGRFRRDSDNIVVEFENKICHIPPSEAFLRQEIQKLLDFANDKKDFHNFVHPVIKAILIHFWIGYLHPFCDGNGRTARALFYWYLLRHEYFWFSYIPLSSAIKASKTEYAKSYIYSEQDDWNVTYFINYNLKKIERALYRFREDLKERFRENSDNLRKLRHLDLNERQKKLLNYFLEHGDSFTTTTTHMNYYGISKQTAINDLKELERRQLLVSVRSGRNINYFPVADMEKLVLRQ